MHVGLMGAVEDMVRFILPLNQGGKGAAEAASKRRKKAYPKAQAAASASSSSPDDEPVDVGSDESNSGSEDENVCDEDDLALTRLWVRLSPAQLSQVNALLEKFPITKDHGRRPRSLKHISRLKGRRRL